uniref:Uncharacterized protein n=1 Tax=Plectus sambesii TaxID=2011161 RepID=A0A914UZB9_9BILA
MSSCTPPKSGFSAFQEGGDFEPTSPRNINGRNRLRSDLELAALRSQPTRVRSSSAPNFDYVRSVPSEMERAQWGGNRSAVDAAHLAVRTRAGEDAHGAALVDGRRE